MTTLTIPPLSGLTPSPFRGGYRLWTIGHGLAFDAVPTYDNGGPSLVPIDGWVSSTTELCRALSSPSVVEAHDGMVTANLWRGDARDPERHAIDGQRFPTRRDATRAKYEAGCLAFMVYEEHASRYGLPTD